MALSWLKRRAKRHFNTSHSKTRATAAAAQSHNLRQSPASLYNLPPELILGICWYLSLPETVTLMLVCGRFWNGRNEPSVFSRAWELIHLRPGSPDLTYARFYVLRMLEYDGLLARGRPTKYCCWGCMKTHERQAFPLKEFKRKPDLKLHLSERYTYYKPGPTFRFCSLAKRRIWYGVRGEMTFAELKYTLSIPRVTADDPYPWLFQVPDRRSCFREHTLFNCRYMSFDYIIPLCKVDDFSFIKMCKVLNIPLCPHVRLGDQQVIALYKTPNRVEACAKCPTKFVIMVRQFINIRVMRGVGSLMSPTDPMWLSQSYVSKSPHLDRHCRLFSRWFKTTYFPPSGKRVKRKKDKGPEEFTHSMTGSSKKLFTGVRSLQD